MSIAQRVAILVDREKNASVFAKKIGISQPSLARMLKNDSGLRSSTVVAILKLYDNPKLNPAWLLMGEGEMWLNEGDEGAELGVGKDEPDDSVVDRMVELLEHRVNELEREILRDNPSLAKKLGIEDD